MRVGREVCRDFARSSRLEWLQTNGAGGFAPADVAGAVGRVGPCSPMRLLVVLSGGHVERAPRPEPGAGPGPGP